MRRHIINAVILWFCLTIIAELVAPLLGFPVAAAQEAVASDDAFRMLLTLGIPVFTFVVALLGYSIWSFRARPGQLEDGDPIQSNTWTTSIWLAVTSALCIFVIVNPGLIGMSIFSNNQPAQLEVRVVAHQWNWEVDYPAQELSGVSEIVLPVDKRVHFQITSADVLHAFWIPAFRSKVDAIPGRITNMVVTPNHIDSFATDFNLRVQCTELCGKDHAKMSLPIRIVSQADFDAWTAAQLAAMPSNTILRGQRLANSQGCVKCHSSDGGTGVGPTWKNIFGSQVELADGSTVAIDEAYLRESIMTPNAKIVKGFQPDVMPKTFGQLLSPDQIHDLINYIESLSTAGNHIDSNLTEYKIALSSDAVRAGKITFSIENNSTTTMHEMIVLKTDLDPEKLPVLEDGSLNEEKLTEDPALAVGDMVWKIGSLEDIEAGKGGDVTIDMPPGRYVMFCNKPGHFKLKMYTTFTVLPPP